MNEFGHFLLAGVAFGRRHPGVTAAVLVLLFLIGNLSTALAAVVTWAGLSGSQKVLQVIYAAWVRVVVVLFCVFMGWRRAAWVIALWSILDFVWPDRGALKITSREVTTTGGQTVTPQVSAEEDLATQLAAYGGFWTASLSKNY